MYINVCFLAALAGPKTDIFLMQALTTQHAFTSRCNSYGERKTITNCLILVISTQLYLPSYLVYQKHATTFNGLRFWSLFYAMMNSWSVQIFRHFVVSFASGTKHQTSSAIASKQSFNVKKIYAITFFSYATNFVYFIKFWSSHHVFWTIYHQ